MTYLRIAALLGAASLAVVVWWLIVANASLRAENKALRAHIETTERIQDADPGDLSGVPDDDVDDGLRALGGSSGGLRRD